MLMRCGLRVGDALRLSLDCLVHDADAAPYLRYFSHKMKREALVPTRWARNPPDQPNR